MGEKLRDLHIYDVYATEELRRKHHMEVKEFSIDGSFLHCESEKGKELYVKRVLLEAHQNHNKTYTITLSQSEYFPFLRKLLKLQRRHIIGQNIGWSSMSVSEDNIEMDVFISKRIAEL